MRRYARRFRRRRGSRRVRRTARRRVRRGRASSRLSLPRYLRPEVKVNYVSDTVNVYHNLVHYWTFPAQISQGTGPNSRIGRKVFLKGIALTLQPYTFSPLVNDAAKDIWFYIDFFFVPRAPTAVWGGVTQSAGVTTDSSNVIRDAMFFPANAAGGSRRSPEESMVRPLFSKNHRLVFTSVDQGAASYAKGYPAFNVYLPIRRTLVWDTSATGGLVNQLMLTVYAVRNNGGSTQPQILTMGVNAKMWFTDV